jgi:hypothetical protein
MSARSIAILTAVFLGAVPATAAAATWTVDPLIPNTGACDPNTFVCKTITQADAAAQNGDTILIKDGAYAEPPLVFSQTNLTIRAENRQKVFITSSSTEDEADVINFEGAGATLEGVIVTVQPKGGHAVFIEAVNTSLNFNVLVRPETAIADFPVVATNDTATNGTTYLLADLVVQQKGGSPAVSIDGGTASVVESTILATAGSGLYYSGHSTTNINTLYRSQVITDAGNAVDIEADDGTGKDRKSVV